MQEVIWSCWHFENAHAHPQWRQAHTCSECKKSFGQVGHLKGHMITHSKACVQCQKSFGRATYLKRHMLTHSGVKAHSCSECEKSFRQVGHLRRHMITHTGEKVHKCEECGDSFGQAGSLKRHKLIHSGEKPHKCTLGCFSKDTLKKNKKPNPVRNWGGPRENISRRRGWSDKSRGSPKALEVWKKLTQNRWRRRRRNSPWQGWCRGVIMSPA